MNYLYQAIGFVGTILIFISFQQRTRKKILFLQIFSGLFFAVHFACLGAWTGCVMNIFGMCRSVVFVNNDKKWAASPIWLGVFIVLFSATGIITWDGFKSVLPLVSMVMSTISLWLKDPKKVRLVTLPTSPMWLAYNAMSGSVSGIVTESLVTASIIISIIRYDILKLPEKKTVNNNDS